MSGSGPIDVDIGHAAPLFTDFNGDDIPDLLVGQMGMGVGRLRIYLNLGTREEPEFGDFYYFQAAGADGTVPTG